MIELLHDYSVRVVIGLAVPNLLILFWLGRAWLIKTTAKNSRLFTLSLLAAYLLAFLLVFLHPDFAQ